MELAIVLGLISALSWGIADFWAGIQARSHTAMTVTFISQLGSGVLLACLLAVIADGIEGQALAWGTFGGMFGALGLLAFYRAMAIGAMSVVAPITAGSILLPAVWGFVIGEAPSGMAIAGMVIAIAGIIIVSIPAEESPHPTENPGLVIALSFFALTAFGIFLIVLDHAGDYGGAISPLWAGLGARTGSMVILSGLLLARVARIDRVSRRVFVLIVAIGVFDTAANVSYAFGTRVASISVVSVVATLYPVVVVLLARAILKERLARMQAVGVVLALTGVAVISAA